MAKRNYTVGYGKPPKHTQWKKGQSGNPSGRRKKEPTFFETYKSILNEKVPVIENGKRRMITKGEALFRCLITNALNGHKQSLKIALECMKECEKALRDGLTRSMDDIIATVLVNISPEDSNL
jgi:hypothetical protein